MRKKKLSLDEQIEYMKNKSGIKFNIVNEETAKDFLKNNSYYFKIKSYAKNYEKYAKGNKIGKYVNLEFAYLIEMSKIDMYFRRFIIKLSLDIEHLLKIQLLRDFSENDKEDGYSIVNDLLIKYPYIRSNIANKSRNSACSDLVLKYKEDFAIWNIVEVLSFGEFIKLYNIYYENYNSKENISEYLWSVSFLRNAAAHNNCLLNSLRNPYSKISRNKKIINYLSTIDGISREARASKMINPVIHDFVVTLYVFNNIKASKSIKEHNMIELKDIIDNRFTDNKDYFETNQLIVSYYKFIKIIVDYFHDLCI